MQSLFSWEGWDILNVICQLILTITGVVAIIFTLKQVANYKDPKLLLEFRCGAGLNKKNKTTYFICIVTVANLGLSKIYLVSSGLMTKNNDKIPGEMKSFFLEPGQKEEFLVLHFQNVIDCEGIVKNRNDKPFVYAENGIGKVYKKQINFTYEQIYEKYQEVKNGTANFMHID